MVKSHGGAPPCTLLPAPVLAIICFFIVYVSGYKKGHVRFHKPENAT